MTWMVLLAVACSGDDKDDSGADGNGGGDSVEARILGLTADATAGEPIFQTNCATCHATDGSGSVGPDIRNTSRDVIVDASVNGRDGMAAFLGNLTEQEIADLSLYAEGL